MIKSNYLTRIDIYLTAGGYAKTSNIDMATSNDIDPRVNSCQLCKTKDS
jgi:hypothetical protein